jgi:hypothetical protein
LSDAIPDLPQATGNGYGVWTDTEYGRAEIDAQIERNRSIGPDITPVFNHGSLVDSVCNQGVAGTDVTVLYHTGVNAAITKVQGNYIPGLELCTVGGLVDSLQGKVILIMQNYAYLGTGNTVHSWNQISRGCSKPPWVPGNNNIKMEVPRRRQFNNWKGIFEDDRSLYSYDEPYDSDYSEQNIIIPTCLRITSQSGEDIDIIRDIVN